MSHDSKLLKKMKKKKKKSLNLDIYNKTNLVE
jgi:hypothetical protein